MTKEQVIQLRKLHEGYNMTVFRTEGTFHKENIQKSHIIWDDNLEVGHYIAVNRNMHLNKDKKITIDTFDYAAITGIYSDRNLEELKMFLDTMKTRGLINEKEYNNIIKDFNF